MRFQYSIFFGPLAFHFTENQFLQNQLFGDTSLNTLLQAASRRTLFGAPLPGMRHANAGTAHTLSHARLCCSWLETIGSWSLRRLRIASFTTQILITNTVGVFFRGSEFA
jgi:hypothetical protein